MKISYQQSINFGAFLIPYKPVVKEFDADSIAYNDKNVSFVEIDVYNNKDIESLKRVSENWEQGLFCNYIYDEAKVYSRSLLSDDTHFYAITTQDDDFSNLDYEKILALTEVSDRDSGSGFIKFIQANPVSIYDKNSKYKCCGTALLDGLKFIYDGLKACPVNEDYVFIFYKKNNFKPIDDNNTYCWEA